MLKAGEGAENAGKMKCRHGQECDCFYSVQTRNHSLIENKDRTSSRLPIHDFSRVSVDRKNREYLDSRK